MKQFIKQHIRESLTEQIIESLLDEDYPTNWNIEEFKKLNSFAQRIKYCQENLQRISSGSSRIVYKIDDEKVLKLAKNKKGLRQNENEAMYGNYHDLSDITARVFAYDENDLWIEMELARRVTPQIFKNVVGYPFDIYANALSKHYSDINPQKRTYAPKIDPEIMSQMWENEFIYSMLSLIGGYDIPVGDLMRLSTYGLVKRDGHDQIVMVDYGLDQNTLKDYYS